MDTSAIFAIMHHLAAFLLVAAITVELVLFDRTLSLGQARTIQRADMLYGLSAGVLVVVGLSRVFYFEQGSSHYFNNVFFLAKMSLFLLVALASIYPTVLFLSWRKPLNAGYLPPLTDIQVRRVRMLLFFEVVGIVGIVLCAPLMARGTGMSE